MADDDSMEAFLNGPRIPVPDFAPHATPPTELGVLVSIDATLRTIAATLTRIADHLDPPTPKLPDVDITPYD